MARFRASGEIRHGPSAWLAPPDLTAALPLLGRSPEWARPPRPARQHHHRHSRLAGEPLPAASPPPAVAFRSACLVGRTWPAYAAKPRGYPSYRPLLKNLRRMGAGVNEER